MREEPIHPLPMTRRGPSRQAEMPESDPEFRIGIPKASASLLELFQASQADGVP